jgi:hypothetical protein
MPLPPESNSEKANQEEPRLEFSYVECLIYAFHRLGRQCPDLLTKDAERMKDFRFRCVVNIYDELYNLSVTCLFLYEYS